jgi:ABC-type multidrug transport system permease subunit/ABC-type multidrug transport system ATPase subunit
MLCDLPYKVTNAITFNLVLYFITNLRREPGAFFFFILFSFATTFVMSMIFRSIASASRTLFQALVPAALLILDLVVFTGFVIPKRYMLGWCKWLNYIDPLAYAFESLIVNEFHNRKFPCDQYVPAPIPGSKYERATGAQRVCTAVGSVPGQSYVLGQDYYESAFDYRWAHRWRNLGIVIAFILFFLAFYMIAAELVSEKKSKGEVLVYRRGHKPAAAAVAEKKHSDPEAAMANIGPIVTAERSRGQNKEGGMLQEQTSVFQWHDVCYDIKIKGEPRRILDNVDGWVKPGTLTALMGVSGAGKTTLLDCLADRINMGVITGEMLVDGKPRDTSFQRKTGYVQQQDLHLQTSTVREALNFSAILRQPADVPKEEKLAYVEEVIKLLDMQEYADAVVGVPGEGLNVEQRKRLTIGVELAAKPPLLLFVDEPTSGLDSQTSWAILDLLEKLTKAGQAVLCTIHQPSAMLFQRFDRLLFLAKGGKTVYFGEIGENSKTLTNYFERNGGHPCPDEANPAEWMLEVIGAAPGSHSDIDWFQTWRQSPEYQEVQAELENIKRQNQDVIAAPVEEDPGSYREFAAPYSVQLKENLYRVFQQYWRSPVYIYSKTALCTLVSLFIGFIFFRAPNSIQGLQNQMFAIFNLYTIFGQIVQQSMPQFVIQRSLYESRERPSKVYSWKIFMLSQIIVELPWNALMGVIMYFCWYYPVGLYNNCPPDEVTERGALMFLYLFMFMIFTGTFSTFIIAGFETAENGGNIANMMFMLCLIFCGVLASPSDFPRFWIFMYRVSPFSYMVDGMLSVGVANTDVVCADNELLTLQPFSNETCKEYLADYMAIANGRLLNPDATSDCTYCPLANTNDFLKSVNADYAHRWRNFGILWAYVFFNVFAALALYWLVRMPKKPRSTKKKTA